MGYQELAAEFMQTMFLLRQGKPHKQFNRSMQGECFVIQYIAHHGGSVLPGEISATMEISSARIAATLKGLERKGLVTRKIDTSDRRKILVDLTPLGKTVAEEHTRAILERTEKMMVLLGEDDAKELVRLAERLVEIMPQLNDKNDHLRSRK